MNLEWSKGAFSTGIQGYYRDSVDFMNRDDQWMVNWYHEVAELAAKYHLMVDMHGAYKNAGIRRTWPNIVAALRHGPTARRLVMASLLLTINWGSYVWAVTNDRVIETALGYFIAPLATMPIRTRGGHAIGTVDARKPPGAGEWTPEERALFQSLVDRLGVALDGAQLYQDAQERAERERLIGDIAAQIRERLERAYPRYAALKRPQPLRIEVPYCQYVRCHQLSSRNPTELHR